MALRAIFGTDRIPTEQGNYSPGDAIVGTPLFNIDLPAVASQIWRMADGYMQVQGNYNYYASNSTVTKSCAVQLPLKSILGTLHDKQVLVAGIRVKVTSNNTGVHLKAPNADGGATFTLIGDSATWPAVGELGARNTAKEFYVEVKIDVANKAVYRRLDGVNLSTLTLPDAFAARFANNQAVNLVLGYPLSYSEGTTTAANVQYKDGYLLEKTEDGILSDFLGPQLVKPVTLTAFDAPAYTNNGSSITHLAALNTPITTYASRNAPLVTSDAAESTATAKFTVDTVAKINAIQLFEEGRRLSGSDSKLKLVVSDGQNTVNGNTANLTDTITQALGYQAARAPDGAVWTKAKLEALTVRLTPVSNQ